MVKAYDARNHELKSRSSYFFSMEKEMKVINWEQDFYTPKYQQ